MADRHRPLRTTTGPWGAFIGMIIPVAIFIVVYMRFCVLTHIKEACHRRRPRALLVISHRLPELFRTKPSSPSAPRSFHRSHKTVARLPVANPRDSTYMKVRTIWRFFLGVIMMLTRCWLSLISALSCRTSSSIACGAVSNFTMISTTGAACRKCRNRPPSAGGYVFHADQILPRQRADGALQLPVLLG